MVDFSEQELNTAEWKGYVKRALESIDYKLIDIDKKMDLLENGVAKMKVKVAAIGGTISLIVTIIILLITKQL